MLIKQEQKTFIESKAAKLLKMIYVIKQVQNRGGLARTLYKQTRTKNIHKK